MPLLSAKSYSESLLEQYEQIKSVNVNLVLAPLGLEAGFVQLVELEGASCPYSSWIHS